MVILAAYVVFSLFCWYRENRRQKGKLSLLINLFLDDLSLTDKFACFYAVALCMSYYYTAYRDTAAMGTDGWYMGFFPQLLFLLSYFAISRFTKKKERVWGLTAMLGVSLVVFLLGVLNRYEVNPLHMTSSGPGFISTMETSTGTAVTGRCCSRSVQGFFCLCGGRKREGRRSCVTGWRRSPCLQALPPAFPKAATAGFLP